MSSHPIQPIEKDENGKLRFKENPIVRWLLDNGGLSLNDIAVQDFTDEDQQHFAQLIGYSLDGYSSLSYVDDIARETAAAMVENPEADHLEKQVEALEDKLKRVRGLLREGVAELYEIHPDDLDGE